MDIATLLWAEGPQKGLKGPQPSAGARRKGTECPKLLVKIYFRFIKKKIIPNIWFINMGTFNKDVSAYIWYMVSEKMTK